MKESSQGVWVSYAVLGLGVVWLVLFASGYAGPLFRSVADVLPPWLITGNLVVCPILLAIAAGPLSISAYVRGVCSVICLLSLGLVAFSSGYNPFVSLAFMTLLGIEAYWVIPAWRRSRTKRSGWSA